VFFKVYLAKFLAHIGHFPLPQSPNGSNPSCFL